MFARASTVNRAAPANGFCNRSQGAPLMHGVSESMAGRAAVLQLMPSSHREEFKGLDSQRRLPGSSGNSGQPEVVV